VFYGHLRSLIVGLDDCKAESKELGASEGEASSSAVGPNDISELDGTSVGTLLVGIVGVTTETLSLLAFA
jgi:hypothetical protein